MTVAENIIKITTELPSTVKLVAVSKFHPVSAILQAYYAGQRIFAESRPQELQAKVLQTADYTDIQWHFIGHLQTNKLKMVLPHCALVQSVDSLRLLEAIQSWGLANSRVMNVLLEMHIAAEESKQGFSSEEILSVLGHCADFPNVRFCGLMGMATFTDDQAVIRCDFSKICTLFNEIKSCSATGLQDFTELSIGMTDDYNIAVEYGATMVRIGTKIFGERNY